MTSGSVAARRIASADAVSWPVFWCTLAVGVVGNMATSPTAPWDARLLALGLGQLCLWVPVVGVSRALRDRSDGARIGTMLAAVVLGLMLRAFAVGAVLGTALGPEEVKWTVRFVGSLLNVGLAFAVSGYIVSVVRERRRQIAQLRMLETQLTALVKQVSTDVEVRHEQAVATVQSVLTAALAELDPQDAGRSLEVLQHMASDVIRPLSHDLAHTHASPRPEIPVLANSEVSWSHVLDDAATGAPFRPTVTAALVGVEALAGTVAVPGAALPLAMLVPMSWVLLTAANCLLRRILPGRALLTRWACVMVAAVAVAALLGLSAVATLPAAPSAAAALLTVTIFTLIFAVGVGIVASFARDRDDVEVALERSTALLRRRLVLWRQAEWFQRKSLSRALHGPVQTAVTAGAIRLDKAIRTGTLGAGTVDEVHAEVRDALQGIAGFSSGATTVEEGFDRIAVTWTGLCDVSIAIGPGIDQRLDGLVALRSCVIDIATEAVSNAVRHGKATSMQVSLAAVREGSDLMLTVTSDSRLAGEPRSQGLGTRQLDECTLWWRLDTEGPDAVMTAVLPIDP